MIIDPKSTYSFRNIEQAAEYIRSKTKYQPHIGLVLGSGLSPLAEAITQPDIVPYEEIPHFPHSGVAGHAGQIVIGTVAGKSVLVMQGRTHFYEGYSPQHITLPIRVMQLLGIHTLILTNAAGGINSTFKAGDLMLIVDHINFVGMAGNNPLRGPNLAEFGPRFPSMTRVYDPQLVELARKSAKALDLTLREGVYVYLAGPTFETPAEIRFLKVIGADAVGMSTAPEATVATHSGMRVLGISTITNISIEDTASTADTTHEEVLQTGRLVIPKLVALLTTLLERLD